MHPKNPYRAPLDFKKLAVKYPEFRKHCRLKPNGNLQYNFNDSNAVRILTQTLLKEDFELELNLPNDHLVPRVPSRLNYLLFIDDVLQANDLGKDVIGIDIGTGASCIYALLGARRFGWKFLAIDSHSTSASFASQNVMNNNLQDLVTTKHSTGNNIMLDFLSKSESYTFTMCNPPFFQNDEMDEKFTENVANGFINEQNSSSATARPPPNSTTVARKNELETEGGEESFVIRMVEESVKIQEKVKLFSSLLGKKKSITAVKRSLDSKQGCRYAFTALEQGKTHRWVVIWSFFDLWLDQTVHNIPYETAKICPSEIENILNSAGIETAKVNGAIVCKITNNYCFRLSNKRNTDYDQPVTKRPRMIDERDHNKIQNAENNKGIPSQFRLIVDEPACSLRLYIVHDPLHLFNQFKQWITNRLKISK